MRIFKVIQMNELQQQLEHIRAAYEALERLPEQIAKAIRIQHGIDVDQETIKRIIDKAILTAFMRGNDGKQG